MGNLVDKSDLLSFIPVFPRNGEVSLVHGKKCSNICFFIHCENQFFNQKHMTATVQPRLLSQELKVAFFSPIELLRCHLFKKIRKARAQCFSRLLLHVYQMRTSVSWTTTASKTKSAAPMDATAFAWLPRQKPQVLLLQVGSAHIFIFQHCYRVMPPYAMISLHGGRNCCPLPSTPKEKKEYTMVSQPLPSISELKQTTTTMATKTWLRKRSNEQNNSSALAFKSVLKLCTYLCTYLSRHLKHNWGKSPKLCVV